MSIYYIFFAEIRRVQEYAGNGLKRNSAFTVSLLLSWDYYWQLFSLVPLSISWITNHYALLSQSVSRHHFRPQHSPPAAHRLSRWEAGALRWAPPAGAGQPWALWPGGVCAGPPGLQLGAALLGGMRESIWSCVHVSGRSPEGAHTSCNS